MTETKEIIKGRAYNFTFDPVKRKRVVGWYVIITESGQEYLVKQNSSQPWRCYRKVYQSDYSFKDLLVSAEDLKRNTWKPSIAWIPIGSIIGGIIGRILPMEFFLGEVNRQPIDIWEGVSHIIILCILTSLLFFFISLYRENRL